MLSLKAQAELPQIETQLQAAKAQSDAATASSTSVPEKNEASKGDDENEAEPSAKSAEEDALARLEGMKA